MDALTMAVRRQGAADALLHHPVQGRQHAGAPLQRLMADHGITGSMSRAGKAWNNSAKESHFPSPKTERTARRVYRTRDAARAEDFDDLERLHNPTGRHSTLGDLSRMEFERQAVLP